MMPAARPAGPPPVRLGWPSTLAAVFLASLSGLALVLYALLRVPLRFTAPFVAFPLGLLLMGAAFALRGRTGPVRRLSRLVLLGTVVGLAATLAYDATRLAVREAFGFSFDPFQAQRMFGSLMLGTDAHSAAAQIAGWVYHVLNGTNFAVMFALLRPEGGLWWGLLWSLVLEAAMLLVYPAAVEVRFDDTGFLIVSVTGHLAWGAVLGLGVRRWRGWTA